MKYLNLNGNSGIESFNIGEDYIEVKFKKSEKIYKYSYSSAGKYSVEKMKELAEKGCGLNSYINSNCKELYECFFDVHRKM